MRKDHFIKILLLFFLAVSMFGCKQKEEPAPAAPSYPDRDVDLPTEVEKFDEDSVQIHYQREDNAYNTWTLWLWDPEGNDDSKEDDFNYQDDYGVIASYPLSYFGDLSGERLGIIVKEKGDWTKDGTDSDRFINFASLQKDENNIYHVYLAGGDEHIYTTAEKIMTDSINQANFKDDHTIYIAASNKIGSYTLYCEGQKVAEGDGSGRKIISDRLDLTADFTKAYSVDVVFKESGEKLSSEVSMTGLYNSDSFNELYYYDGELGALYTKNRTDFVVWSPVSEKIELRVYENGTPKSVSSSGDDTYEAYEMEKAEKGTFRYTLTGDQEGKYYTYFVVNANHPEGIETIDPYAKGAGVNGIRGMVVDFSKTDPEGWNSVKYLPYDRKELTVWETHVADVTSSPTWTGSEENRRKYLGVIEEGTTYTEGDMVVTTGFDHIKELGVNAVQFIPVFDQANDETKYTFNWGYNPLNYNVPEGMYESDPYDGYVRIRELKQVIQAMNKAGITVIMDVVYNHMNGAVNSPFDILMPEYFFRYKNDGSLSNGSGCGNETASEMPMMRKFIIDSVCFWTEEYKFGGFRFDLMGLHDIDTMNAVAEAAKKIDPYTVIYGEPWTGGGTPLNSDLQAIQANANKFNGYGQFNDQMRDALIKGGLNGPDAKGWVTGTTLSQADVKAIEAGINGITSNAAYSINDPDKTVNYVTCHDNYTLYDRVKAAGITDEETIRKMCVLANSVVFTSGGTGFMLAGEEFLRTKKGNSNSYMSSDDINNLDYSLKIRNHDVYESYQKLIAFKQNVKQLHEKDPQIEVEVSDGGAVLSYTLVSGGKTYTVIHNNGVQAATSFDLKGQKVYLNTLGNELGDSFIPEPYQTVILEK